MNRTIFIYFFISISAYSCSQMSCGKIPSGVELDSSIKDKVEKHINDSGFESGEDEMLMYQNQFIGTYYNDDSVQVSVGQRDNKRMLFRSFYYWHNDTLNIYGGFGLFNGMGFKIKLSDNMVSVYHLVLSDMPAYANNVNDKLSSALEVPCTNTSVILSELPDSNENQVIYGYVEFNSGDYYASQGFGKGKELLPRTKHRADMKIYFKSAHLAMD